MKIEIKSLAGEFGENKDVARRLRIKKIMPALLDNDEVILDFSGMTGATQSFIHALIVAPIREFNDVFFDKVRFKNCSPTIMQVVKIVSEYTQESLEETD